MFKYVDVAVPVAVRKTFAYAVPPLLQSRLQIGARVLVPFSRRALTGVVVSGSDERPEGDFKVRPVRELLDNTPIIPKDLVAAALWVADHYFTYPGEVLKSLFPAGSQTSGSPTVRLTSRAEQLMAGGFRPPGLHRQEYALLDTLANHGAQALKALSELSGVRDPYPWIESLCQANWAAMEIEQLEPRVRVKEQLGIRVVAARVEEAAGLPHAQRRVYALLDAGGKPLPLQMILQGARASSSAAKALQEKGLVEIGPMQIDRVPLDLAQSPARKELTLTGAQRAVFDELCGMLRQQAASRCLLHGVTGSGKTEIYLRLIAEVIREGWSALLLVPEIGLTPLLSRIALSHFPDRVALLHSGMSPGERFDQWERIRSGRAPVVVGTRSAVFAPVAGLRLVIIDEEQDSSYKQDEAPCYHAREVAWHRMQSSCGVMLLGSATPSMETYHAARSGQLRMLTLAERIESRPMPEVAVVDMAVEFRRHGKNAVLSEPLLEKLRERLERKEQAIVLLNRRGYSRTLLCRSCGHTFVCRDCSIAMRFHRDENVLLCHYCGREEEIPSRCASCNGEYIYFVGVGTEQLEELLRARLPSARIARVDRDSTRRRGALRRLLLDFADHKIDLLVGTQMIAKGHDFPKVTLVGVVAADAGLSFPDFRSAERTFQLLTQVAGRSGRGEVPGEVIVQSFYPEHYALQFSRKQDYSGFYQREIEYRQLLGYPPFTNLVQVLVSDESQAKALRIGEKIAAALKASAASDGREGRVKVLGPAPAPLEKLRGKFRIQILVKAKSDVFAGSVLREAFDQLSQHKVELKNVQVDVDPLTLL